MDPDERGGGAGNENPDLVQEVVERVELPVCGERHTKTEVVEESW